MATVQDMMFRFALIVDPRDKNQTLFTAGTIGVNDGDKFSKQRLLDIYNQARSVFFNTIRMTRSAEVLGRDLRTLIKNKVDFTFSAGIATKPADCAWPISILALTGEQIHILPQNYVQLVRLAHYQPWIESTTNRFVFEDATTFFSLSGATYIANAADYRLTYYSLPTYSLTDVTGGATVELLDSLWQAHLIEIAIAIAMEQGLADVIKLATTLVQLKGG